MKVCKEEKTPETSPADLTFHLHSQTNLFLLSNNQSTDIVCLQMQKLQSNLRDHNTPFAFQIHARLRGCWFLRRNSTVSSHPHDI
ncbi:hypothetical protein QVD17_15915 [Tagetes erecta]|uniref:Uncharacterized protein n=1 Tax=Tagetes erecta TaxID=13708 RepID=A0AAD8P027_TARER|nr:hypothetical protein QVD17_15915 [Tagetes erecta]